MSLGPPAPQDGYKKASFPLFLSFSFSFIFRPMVLLSLTFPDLPPCLHPSPPPGPSWSPLPAAIPPVQSRADTEAGPEQKRGPTSPAGVMAGGLTIPKEKGYCVFSQLPAEPQHPCPLRLRCRGGRQWWWHRGLRSQSQSNQIHVLFSVTLSFKELITWDGLHSIGR